MLYNIPVRTGRNLGAAGVLELARRSRTSSGSSRPLPALDVDTLEILAGAPRDFSVLGGEDPFLFPLVLMGGAGTICAAAHVVHRAVRRHDRVRARGQGRRRPRPRRGAAPGRAGRFAEPNPSVFKGVLHAQGRIPTPDVRLPLVNAATASIDRALAAVDAAT